MRVLVIDDDAGVRMLVAQVLTAEGFAITTADDGIDGLVQLDRQQFDLIVLDFAMPRMGGDEFLQVLRDRGIQVPVLLLSAHDSTYTRASGATETMSKFEASP